MSSRSLRYCASAAVAAALVAAWVYHAVPVADAPLSLASLLHGRHLDRIDVIGGTRASFRVAGASPAEAAEAVALRSGLPARAEGDGIVLDVPGYGEAAAIEALASLGIRGELTFQMVAHGKFPCEQAASDPAARELGLATGEDLWQHDASGARHRDCYLHGDRLADWLESAAPALEPGLEIAVGEGFEGDPRTFVIEREPILTGARIEAAEVAANPVTLSPEVLLHFDGAGTAAFAEATERRAGEKLAILIDGEVVVAPVIQERIDGGVASIHLGQDSDPVSVQILANTLERGPLDFELERIETTAVSPSASEQRMRAALAAFAALLGAAAAVLILALGRLAPAADPAVAPRQGAARWPAWLRLGVTIGGGAAAAWLLPRVPLAGIDLRELAALAQFRGLEIPASSAFGLGLAPVVTAFVLVELITLAVPRWRGLRTAGPEGRARLARAVAALTVVSALAHGWLVADWLTSIQWPVVAEPGMAFRIQTTATLAAGAVALVVVAGLLGRFGLTGGYSTLLAAAIAADLWRGLRGSELPGAALSPTSAVVTSAAILIPVALTGWLLRFRVRGSEKLQLPACGVVPLHVLPLFAAAAATLEMLGLGAARPASAGPLASVAIAAALGLALSWIFSRPPRGAVRVTRGAASGGLAPWPAAAVSTAYVVGLALLSWAAAEHAPAMALAPLGAAVLAAVGLDVAAEWRARRRRELVEVWSMHRVQLVDLALGALRSAGIDAHARGIYHRALLHFFGPFVPVAIYVPPEDAERARELLRSMGG